MFHPPIPASINGSLMNLRKCIEMLREMQRSGQWTQGLATPGGTHRVVPYRDKRLTHLFKNFFEGNGRVVMLICVHQSVEDYEETMVCCSSISPIFIGIVETHATSVV